MDEGPFRMPRQADRNPASRPEPVSQPIPEPEPVVTKEEPRTVHRPTAAHRQREDNNPLKRFIVPIIAVVVIVVVVIAWLLFASTQKQDTETGIDSSKYQAVFFVNDNVYFGKLQDFNTQYYKMTNVFYPQTQNSATTESSKQQSSNQSNITLLKLGDAIHGPEDAMMIAKDQVLFYQNLKPDSKVSKVIDGQK